MAILTLPIGAAPLTNDWPAWRGPLANGVSPTANPPITWSETNNIRWKIELPGKGHSTPIIFGDRIYVTVAAPVGDAQPPVHDDAPGVHDSVPVTHRHQFSLMALNRRDGALAWKRVAKEEFPHEGGHYTGSLASNSPVTDGEMIYASFGSRGLYAYDLDGNLKWKKDLGKMRTLHSHGEGSSPVIHKDALILCWDHEADSFLYKFNKRTGEQIWKIPRDEKTSWATPLIVEHKDRTQIITSATKRVRGYDFDSGELIWEWKGLAMNAIASPVATQGIAIIGNSYDFAAMVAVKLDEARGDITDTKHVAWTLNRLTPYVPSPLLYDDTLYFLRHNQNVLSRLNPITGEFRGDPIRLTGIRDFIFGSPVGAANRIYVPSRDGVTVVLSHDRENKQLAANRLNDSFSASPALAGRELYLRGEKFLYCIAEPKSSALLPFAPPATSSPMRRMVLLTDGVTNVGTAKTAVNLIRYKPEECVAILDPSNAGKTSRDLFGLGNVPIIRSLAEAKDANVVAIGIAPAGGKLSPTLRVAISEAISRGMEVLSGLHAFVSDDPELAESARQKNVRIFDVRKNTERDVTQRKNINPRCLRIHTVGHDCNVGKMVVSVEVAQALRKRGLDAKFVATGQTGIMIEGDGCPIDAVVADFINGAAEKLVLQNQHHEILLIEGQGSIIHPRYSAVTLGLLHGCVPQGLILCYEMGRSTVYGMDHIKLPALKQFKDLYEINASTQHPCRVIAIGINGRRFTDAEVEEERKRIEGGLGLPAADVLRHGPDRLVDAILSNRESLLSA